MAVGCRPIHRYFLIPLLLPDLSLPHSSFQMQNHGFQDENDRPPPYTTSNYSNLYPSLPQYSASPPAPINTHHTVTGGQPHPSTARKAPKKYQSHCIAIAVVFILVVVAVGAVLVWYFLSNACILGRRCGENGECISSSETCDEEKDCGGGEDDTHCFRLYGPDFMLQSFSKQDRKWKPVCSHRWDNSMGRKTCMEIGYGRNDYAGYGEMNPGSGSSDGYMMLKLGSSDDDIEMTDSSSIVIIIIIIIATIISIGSAGPELVTVLLRCPPECGKSDQTRIVGGQTVTSNTRWPWQVSLHSSGRHICGGSIITPTWILSAAHCFQSLRFPNQWTVYAGFLNQFEIQSVSGKSVSRIISHSGFDPTTNDNDIALMKLTTPLTLSVPPVMTDNPTCFFLTLASVRPVCLPNAGLSFTAPRECFITGWGALFSQGPASPTLQEARISLIDRSVCNSRPVYNGQITNTMICAGRLQGGVDSCQVSIPYQIQADASGDSGGPLVTRENSLWWLVGDTSWGIGCASVNKPGVYGNVTVFLEWIYQQMQGLAVGDGATPKPDDDAAAQEGFHSPTVEHGEDGSGKMSLLLSPQEVEVLLGSLGYRVGVERPDEVLCDMDTKETPDGARDDFHSDVRRRVVTTHSLVVNNHLLSFIDIQREVVGSAQRLRGKGSLGKPVEEGTNPSHTTWALGVPPDPEVPHRPQVPPHPGVPPGPWEYLLILKYPIVLNTPSSSCTSSSGSTTWALGVPPDPEVLHRPHVPPHPGAPPGPWEYLLTLKYPIVLKYLLIREYRLGLKHHWILRCYCSEMPDAEEGNCYCNVAQDNPHINQGYQHDDDDYSESNPTVQPKPINTHHTVTAGLPHPTKDSKVRLYGPDFLLQSFSNRDQKWKPVCSLGWDDNMGRKTCSEIGYGRTDYIGFDQMSPDTKSDGYMMLNANSSYGEYTHTQLTESSYCPSDAAVTLKCIESSTVSFFFPAAECGKSTVQTWIVGGEDVSSQTRWPWQVSLHSSGYHRCGGSIITPSWIVTAAHCFRLLSEPNQWTVYAGYLTQSEMRFVTGQSVSQIISHPGYDASTHANDIALMKLRTPLILDFNVQPVCLPNAGISFSAPTDGFITGWGSQVNQGYGSNVLQEARVSLISRSVCNSWQVYNGKITNAMICAGQLEGGVDSCQGDSGGPLVAQENSLWWLVGDTSWGDGCGLRNKPGVYGNVAHFLEWIYQEMQVWTEY
ncbi:hypothetical protein NFI96_012648, partial [Prochilodus magdalenae]